VSKGTYGEAKVTGSVNPRLYEIPFTPEAPDASLAFQEPPHG